MNPGPKNPERLSLKPDKPRAEDHPQPCVVSRLPSNELQGLGFRVQALQPVFSCLKKIGEREPENPIHLTEGRFASHTKDSGVLSLLPRQPSLFFMFFQHLVTAAWTFEPSALEVALKSCGGRDYRRIIP